MTKPSPDTSAGQRGPSEHAIREQIIAAANAYFSRYGYAKTTVSELAREIGFSKAYIYKFFDSKQAIGEAICAMTLEAIDAAAVAALAQGGGGAQQLRRLFRSIVDESARLFFADRQLYAIAAHSTEEKWQSSSVHAERIHTLLCGVLDAGRATNEFERTTPLDETARAILQAMQPFINPLMLQYNLDRLPAGPDEVISLILRSLRNSNE
jgi:AcrR family transcriptional regulator